VVGILARTVLAALEPDAPGARRLAGRRWAERCGFPDYRLGAP
jgi:hypothetical protein